MNFVIACSAIFVSIVFIRTSCPTVFLGDSGEMISAAYTLGIGHPPGYPLYMMTAKISSFMPLGDVAFRANLLSSFLAVMVFVAMYLTAFTLLKALFRKKPDTLMRLVALLVSYVFVFSYIFWFQAGQAKGGVYIMSHLAGLLGVLFCVKFVYEKKLKYLYAAAFIAGFMPAVHHSMGILMIFILAGLIMNLRKTGFKQRLAALGFFMLSFFTSYLYLFIRVKASPAVCWGDMNSAVQVMNHIIRKVYFSIQKGPFNADVILFKLRHYYGQFSSSYKMGMLLSAAGFIFVFMNSKKLFFTLLAYTAASLAGLFYLTGYSFAPFNVYMNSGFYIILDIALVLTAGAGAYGLLNLIKEKRGRVKTLAAAALFVLPLYQLVSFYPVNDQSRKFMAYDNAMNDFKTVNDGDIIFAEEDFQVFNLLYFKQVRGMFPGIRAYDRSANFLDTSIFDSFRDAGMEQKLSVKARSRAELEYMMMQYTLKLERAAEYKVILENPGKVYYTGIADFNALKYSTVPYGILFKIEPEKAKKYNAAALMGLYTIRDYFNNRKLDLYYRDVVGRYFVQRAKYAAINGNEIEFSYNKRWAESIASGSGPVLNLIAEIYYTDLKDVPKAIEYMEKIMHMNPYDYASLDVLLRFCIIADREKALVWLRHYYSIATSNAVRNTILVKINELKQELKK